MESSSSPELGEQYLLPDDAFVNYNSAWSKFPEKNDAPAILMEDALVQNASFSGNNLGNFSATRTSFFNVSFERASFTGAFEDCGFYNCYFDGAKLGGSVFVDCLIKDCTFDGADIKDADLIGTSLQNSAE